MIFKDLLNAFNLAQIGGKSSCVTPIITTSGTAYSSGDCIGGIIQLKDAMNKTNGTSILKSIFLRDNDGQNADLTILFFNSNPIAATTTDNSPFAYGTTFFYNQIGKINITSDDYEMIDAKGVVDIDAYSKVLQSSNNSTDLFVIIIAKSSPTYTAGSNSLNITFSFLQD